MKIMSDNENEEVSSAEELAKPLDVPAISGTLSDNPNEMASTLRVLYLPKFNVGVDKLSSKAKGRILKRLMSYPLEDKDYKPQTQLEADIFAVGDRLLEAKFLLVMARYGGLIEDEYKDGNIDFTNEGVVDSSKKEGN